MQPLTAYEKADKARKYKELNDLLNAKRALEDEIGELGKKMNALRERANQLEYEFDALAIKVEPTEVVSVQKAKKKVDPRIAAIIDRLQKRPELWEDLADKLELDEFDHY